MRLFMFRHLDEIQYLFIVWTNLVNLVYLEMEKLVFFNIQT